MVAERAQIAHEHRLGAARLQRRQQRGGPRVRRRRRARDGAAAMPPKSTDPRRCASLTLCRNSSSSTSVASTMPGDAARPEQARGRGEHGSWAHCRPSRAASAAARIGSPCRLTWAAIATLASSLSLGPLRLAQDGEAQVGLERLPGRVEHRHAVQAGHLRRRVHDRGARGVLHRLADEHGADLPPQLLDLRVVGRQAPRPPAGRALAAAAGPDCCRTRP